MSFHHDLKISMKVTNRHVFGWCLFDLANSVLIINGAIYFPQWFVVENHGGDVLFNISLVVSTVIVFLSAPYIGLLSDEKISKWSVLLCTAIVLFLATISLAIIDQHVAEHKIRVGLSLIAFIGVLCAYQLGATVYSSMLSQLAEAKEYVKLSGYGAACTWVGAVAGILFVLPFVQGRVAFCRLSGPRAAFVPSALAYGVITAISLVFLPRLSPLEKSRSISFRTLKQDLWQLLTKKQVVLFLLSFILFSDAILTIGSNAPLYLSQVMQFSDTSRAMLFLLLFVCMAVGSLVPQRLRVNLRHSLMVILFGWVIILIPTSLIHSKWAFWVCFAIIGLLYGALINVSRVIFLVLSPASRVGEYFGLYTSFERVATFIGPVLWSLAVGMASLGANRYRFAMLSMDALILCGLYVFRRIQFDDRALR
jgi:MFS transporter, UMF1 family